MQDLLAGSRISSQIGQGTNNAAEMSYASKSSLLYRGINCGEKPEHLVIPGHLPNKEASVH